MDILQRLLFGFSARQQEGQRPSPSRTSSSANLPDDIAQLATPLTTHNSAQGLSDNAESGTSPSEIRSQGHVSGSRPAVDRTQTTAKQFTSRALGRSSASDVNTDRLPSAPPTSLGNTIPTSLNECLPHVSPKEFPGADFPKAYSIGTLASGTPYDNRTHGSESGLHPFTKPPTFRSPLRRKGTSHANNTAFQGSTTVPRHNASSHESGVVSSQTNQPLRSRAFMQHSNGTSNVGRTKVPASVPRSDPLESQTVPSQMTRSQGIASSLRRSGTSNTTTVLAPVPSSASPRRPDPASRQTTQSSMAPTSATSDDARGGGSTGIHTQTPGTPFDAHSDELDGVHSRAVEIPPAPEHQSYEGMCADPLNKPSITSGELPSEEMEPSYGSYSSTTPKQATDSQPSTDLPEEQSDTLNEELQEVELDDLTTEDIIIAIMGPTGAGKSSFVAKAVGNGDEGVGHALTSHTSEIKSTRCMIKGSNVVLVDTPGFDDTSKSDLEILESISEWLSKTYKKGTLLSNILYFHRISDNRMAGTPLKNLGIFQKLCGAKAMSQVVLVTTMWDEVDGVVGNERLEELKNNYWKLMIAQGSTTYCYLNTLESSSQLLSQLIEKKQREVREVRLQKEIAGEGLEVRETDAGRELYSRLDQIAEKRREILARMTAKKHLAGDQATADDLRKQYDSLKAELDQTLQQVRALKLTTTKRVASYVRKSLKR